MDVDVGLHHASPPPSYCGYWPAWISCEYAGTASSMPSAPPSAVGIDGFWFGASEAPRPAERGGDLRLLVRWVGGHRAETPQARGLGARRLPVERRPQLVLRQR